MGFAADQLKSKALGAVEEAAERSLSGPIERSKALAFALAYLWTRSGGDRGPYYWLWESLVEANDISRSQNVSAAMNAILRATGRSRAKT